ncbi:MAG: Triosephosphate isomerase [Candidatus Gottesmanbacteria bacterium GW2011_GWA1_44_24b]|uniref:Triosephosphate isomerase n=2 Tax=Candidatus Gottesmaniibacteriota TaxID=1752720 RepID=A0A0G1KWW8_9BACT|nr:MAG: Triosephosphate isomerase [Candidatus Gottesmanbacteria bacterium GW2011_GWA1_44_24b]
MQCLLPGMKQLYLVANWKSNKTVDEAKNWIFQFKFRKTPDNLTIILCAPYTVLSLLKDEIEKAALPIFLGAQTISSFPNGAFTGEISAEMLKGLVEYVIIGHSERRRYFHETEEELQKKAQEAASRGLKIIYCVEGVNQRIPENAALVLYEPQTAIGSGKAEDPAISNQICREISEKNHDIPVLYGGSVTEATLPGFLSQPSISGVGVGKASLDPEQFLRLVEAVSSYE